MTGHLLPDDTLALIRREYYGHRKIIDAYRAGMVPAEGQALHGYIMAVEAMSKLLEHVEALDEDDSSEVAYLGLAYVDKWQRWNDNPADQAAFNDVHDAQVALRDAAIMYSVGIGGPE